MSLGRFGFSNKFLICKALLIDHNVDCKPFIKRSKLNTVVQNITLAYLKLKLFFQTIVSFNLLLNLYKLCLPFKCLKNLKTLLMSIFPNFTNFDDVTANSLRA